MRATRFAACVVFPCVLACSLTASGQDEKPWVVYEGGNGPGKGKHVVLVTGDEEYRSEEGLPQLGKILAKHHGFKCTVLFAIDPKDGTINPNKYNIPGLEALAGFPSSVGGAVAMNAGVVDGRPQGIQIIGGRFREDLCLAAAAEVEARLGVPTPIDPRS